MKKQALRKVLLPVIFFVLLISAAACGKKETEDKHITIGGTAISEVTYEAIRPHFEKLGYTTEFVMFDANPVVLEACNSGEVDMALGQHKKFVESFNESNDGALIMAKPYGYYTGIGLYSDKYTSVEEFQEGSQIAIMNDSMNMDIALRILEEAGFIAIDEDVEVATTADITENFRNLEIIDMDQAQTVTALKDLDAACVFFTHMANAGMEPSDFIMRDTQMIKYPMGVIVREEDGQADWAVSFAECFKIKEVRAEIDKEFPGVFEFYEDDKQAE